jgi:glucose/arabinose dehydrogenase
MHIKTLLLAACTAGLIPITLAGPSLAQETDGLKLPPGFHASVVADHLGVLRHLAFRDNDDLYVSTQWNVTGTSGDIIAIHLDKDRKADKTQHFGVMAGGTGIRFYKGALYAASTSRVYRYSFHGRDLVPNSEPAIVIDGMPATRNTARGLAFEGKGNLYVSMGATAATNWCIDPNSPKSAPTGLKPCPLLDVRSGIWRFSDSKLNQQFPRDGEKFATGIRDMAALTWSPADGALYGIMHGRDNTYKDFPKAVTADQDDAISDEMDKVTKGTDFGWPYTYWDGVRKMRIVAPEYSGNNTTEAPAGQYATPVEYFHSRSSPLDIAFYTGKMFPASYRGGAFISRHGGNGAGMNRPNGNNGYDVLFIPFDKNGVAGPAQEFAENFAGPNVTDKGNKAKYRPVGVGVAPDGSLYVTDSQSGKIWRIVYGN